MARIAVIVASIAAFACTSASASAATYYVSTTGSDANPCTQGSPCATVGHALTVHRVSPTPTDVISVGAGTFVESVVATDPNDDGLTIEGTLGAGGSRDTTLRASAASTCNCALQLGASPDVEVTLRDVSVDAVGASFTSRLLALRGSSDLSNVHATEPNDGGAFADGDAVFVFGDVGTTIDHSVIENQGQFGDGVVSNGVPGSGVTVLDSEIHVLQAEAIHQTQASQSGPVEVRRSWLDVGSGANEAMEAAGSFTLDSSLVTGSKNGVISENHAGGTGKVLNTTIDAGSPGVFDGDSALTLESLDAAPRIDVKVDSSILVEGVHKLTGPSLNGPGSATCSYSDVPSSLTAGPPYTIDCTTGGGSTNTTTAPAKLFVGGSPFDWHLQPTASAIDTGRPGQVKNGQSPLDLDGGPRVLAATSPACPGIRDKGAYETAGALCNIRPPVIEHAAVARVGQKMSMDRGVWSPNAVSFDRQWVRCDDPSPAAPCVDIPGKTRSVYTPVADDVAKVLRVRVVAHDAGGGSLQAISDTSVPVISPIPEVKDPPTIDGGATPHVGARLRGHHGQWTDTPTNYRYQWLTCDPNGNGCFEIPGATASTYTTAPFDNGHTLRLSVIAEGTVGESHPATSAATGVVT